MVILREIEIYTEVNIFVHSIFKNLLYKNYEELKVYLLSSYKRLYKRSMRERKRDGNEIALSPLLCRCIYYSCLSLSNVNLNSKF